MFNKSPCRKLFFSEEKISTVDDIMRRNENLFGYNFNKICLRQDPTYSIPDAVN
jgi:hypothetical protein